MQPDDSSPTKKGDRSSPKMSWEDEFKADAMKPFRQRNYSQSRRERLARALRQLRRERSERTKAGW